MAYEKYTWVDGELITAEKLNHMEDGIAEGGDCGYECVETAEQLFTETVTTTSAGGANRAQFAYSDPITADNIIVMFNGTEYRCPKIVDEGIMFYGGFDPNAGMPDFTNYPFVIGGTGGMNSIVTESPMTVTVSASVTSSTVETTECFEKAVCESAFYVLESHVNSAQEMALSKTWQEIYDAAETKVVLLKRREDTQIIFEYLTSLNETSGSYRVTFGNSDNYTAGSKDDYPVNGGK